MSVVHHGNAASVSYNDGAARTARRIYRLPCLIVPALFKPAADVYIPVPSVAIERMDEVLTKPRATDARF